MDYVIFIKAKSPEDLAGRLDEVKRQHPLRKNDRVVLVINDERILLCPFEFKAPGWLKWLELKERISDEASGILSIEDRGDVAVDFQIFDRIQDHLRGAFICCPRDVLEDYINIVSREGLLVDGLSIPALVNIERALSVTQGELRRSVFLDFAGSRVNLAVFNEGKCELVRIIHFDDLGEALSEVIRSLKSVSSRSHDKDCQELYVLGDLGPNQELINKIAQALSVKATPVPAGDDISDVAHERVFRLNLVRQYVFSRTLRKKVSLLIGAVIVALALAAMWCGYLIIEGNSQRTEVQRTYDRAQLDHARQLEQELKEKK